jgi:hypothetical protein
MCDASKGERLIKPGDMLQLPDHLVKAIHSSRMCRAGLAQKSLKEPMLSAKGHWRHGLSTQPDHLDQQQYWYGPGASLNLRMLAANHPRNLVVELWRC